MSNDSENVAITGAGVGEMPAAPKPLHPREKFPQLYPQFEQLQAEKAELEKVVNPLRAARDAIVAEMAPLEAKARELADQIKSHMPRMGELDRQISALARAMGGKTMSDSAK